MMETKESSPSMSTGPVALWRLGRLGLRLLLPLGFVAMISSLLMGATLFVAYRWQRASVINLQREMAAKAAIAIEGYVEGIEAKVTLSAQSLGLIRADTDQQHLILRRLLEQQLAIGELVIIDENGQETVREVPRLLATSPRELTNRAQAQEFIRAMEGENYISPIYFARDEPYVTMAVPIRDVNNEIAGVLAAEVSLVFVWDVVSQPGFGQTGYAYAVDEQGQLIVSRRVLALQPEIGAEELVGVEAAIAGEPGVREYTGLRGKPVIGAWQPIERTGWKVIAELPTSEAYAHLRSLLPLLVLQVLVGGVVVAGAWLYVTRRVITPILGVQQGAQFIGDGHLDYRLEVKTKDELADVGRVFNSMAAQLQDLVGGLEQRVAERTADLERRSVQLEAAAQVAREAAAIRDVVELLDATVRLISNRFGFYHAGVFLLDETGEYAVLRAASSEGGQRMLARRHKLKVGEVGIVGYAAGTGEPRIALDVGADAVYFDNPDLPHTRSEMALPLKVREQTIGVLDVQSEEAAAFSDEDVAALQTLADQVALAIENARLLAEAEERLQEVNVLLGRYGREGWERLVMERPGWGYVYDGTEVVPQETISAVKTEPQFTMPLQVRGEVIGHLDLALADRSLNPEEVVLVQDVTEQASLALESARLFRETQRVLGETEALYRASRAIGAATSPEEVGQALVDYAAASGVDAARVLLFEHDEQDQLAYIVMREGWTVDDRPAQPYGMRLPLADYPLADIMDPNEPVIVEDVLADPRANEATHILIATVSGLRSFAMVPITAGERRIGMLFAARNEPSAFAKELIRGYWTLAGQAAVAFERMRLFEEAQRRAERERLVARITARVRASTEVDTILRTAIRELGQALRASDGLIRLEAGDRASSSAANKGVMTDDSANT